MASNLDYRDRKEYCYSGEWKTEPPTVEGWYWAKPKRAVYNEHGENVQVVYVGNMKVDVSDDDSLYVISSFTHWLGPIPPPLPPGE